VNLTKKTKIGIATGVLVLAAGAGTAAAATGMDGDGGSGQVITGPAADQARAAAVTAVPGGQPGEVRGESDNGATYGVDVARPDGSRVEVDLDGGNRVLGTQPAGPDTNGDAGSEGAGTDGAGDGDGG